GKATATFDAQKSKKIELNLNLSFLENVKNPVVGVNVLNQVGDIIVTSNTRRMGWTPKEVLKNKNIKAQITIDNIFTNDTYYISVVIANKDKDPFLIKERCGKFIVYGRDANAAHALSHPRQEFKIS